MDCRSRCAAPRVRGRIMKSWRDVLKVHPAAELFPLMSEAELRELGEDIKKTGLKMPLTVWSPDKKLNPDFISARTVPPTCELLDGRNRLDALELIGIKLVTDDGKFDWLALWAETVRGMLHVSKADDP